MADVTTNSSKWEYTFHFDRDGEQTTRVFSVDNPISSAAGVSAAKAFRDVFIGAASSPFSVIDPTQFIQPTGWRDENPNEAPWTTKAVYLKRIDTTEVTYDGGTASTGRNIAIAAGSSVIAVTYDDLVESNPPVVNYFNASTGKWSTCTVTKGDGNYFNAAPGIGATKLSVYVPPKLDTDVQPDFAIFNDPWSS